MAGNTGGFAVLPQYQGNYYDLQRQQALAQALMGQSLQPQQIQATGSGPFTVMPKYSIGGGLSQLGQALLAAKMGNKVSQGYNQLGAQQAQAFGFGGSAPQQQTAAADSQGGVSEGSGQSGAPMVASGQGSGQPQAQGMPQATQGASSPMNPLGLPPALAYSAFAADPAKYAEIQAQAYKPADIVSQIRAAGIDPSSALGRQVAQQALAKANYQAPTSIRGQVYADMNGVHTLPAPAPEGYQNFQDTDGNWHTVAVQGGPQAVQGNSAAVAGGKAQFNVMPGFRNGQPVYTTAADVANGVNGTPAGGAQGGVNAGRFGGYQAPGGTPVAPSLAPGAEDLAKGSADSFNGLRSAASSTPTAIDGYNKAEQALLAGATTGPGSTLGANIVGKLNTAGIPILKGDATGYQSLQKFLSNANAQAASASGYNGSDARFEAFSHGQPNTETMNPQALRYAIQYVRGQQAGVQAKYQAAQSFLNANGNSTVNYPQFEAQWNRTYNPDVMMVRSMPNQADQQGYMNQLKQQGTLNDFIKSYQGMQQMGAF